MSMPRSDGSWLWQKALLDRTQPNSYLCSATGTVALGDLADGSSLDGDVSELCGRSVLVATWDQLTAGLALLELDGVARRLILCPPDLADEHLDFIIKSASVDAIVSDGGSQAANHPAIGPRVTCRAQVTPGVCDRTTGYETEWILVTSGTTGRPKMVQHTLSTLAGAIKGKGTAGSPLVWSTFYDIRRYGGLQVFLRAMLGGNSLVLSSAGESINDFLMRTGSWGVTHISGTPSHWRRALMSPSAHHIKPQYVRLSGEIVDQAILDQLRCAYPDAQLTHAFASTEAGVAFDVGDGRAGFPAELVHQAGGAVEVKIEEGTLRIRSHRVARRYLGQLNDAIADMDGFVDTRDIVELRGDRYYFIGRRDGVINVGGLKVHPEEVESIINRHPQVCMSLVRTRKNPITGALVVADVVLTKGAGCAGAQTSQLEDQILNLCRQALPRYKVPAAIRIVNELAVSATGKIVRRHA